MFSSGPGLHSSINPIHTGTFDPSVLKKRGRKPNIVGDAFDEKILRGPCAPGDTYGIKMTGIKQVADNIIK